MTASRLCPLGEGVYRMIPLIHPAPLARPFSKGLHIYGLSYHGQLAITEISAALPQNTYSAALPDFVRRSFPLAAGHSPCAVRIPKGRHLDGQYRRQLIRIRRVLYRTLRIAEGVTPQPPCRRHYLSQQLMQGSMVRMIFGTSASSQPLSIFTRAGRLALVGVRRRKRSRFFVPLPFT